MNLTYSQIIFAFSNFSIIYLLFFSIYPYYYYFNLTLFLYITLSFSSLIDFFIRFIFIFSDFSFAAFIIIESTFALYIFLKMNTLCELLINFFLQLNITFHFVQKLLFLGISLLPNSLKITD